MELRIFCLANVNFTQMLILISFYSLLEVGCRSGRFPGKGELVGADI